MEIFFELSQSILNINQALESSFASFNCNRSLLQVVYCIYVSVFCLEML